MKTVALFSLAVLALGADPEFNKDGELVRPKNYREWIFLSSGVGMSYTTGNLPFTNVFVEPSAYRKFTETGRWPDKSIFALELRQPATEGSINKGGQYQTSFLRGEFAVKDTARFPDGWGYFGFEGSAATAKFSAPKLVVMPATVRMPRSNTHSSSSIPRCSKSRRLRAR